MSVKLKIQNSKFKTWTANGFTLIELMVVISIIGMLASVVLASLGAARSKGTQAAGQIFDSHLYQAFGADALGIWDFDEHPVGDVIPGTNTIVDKSAYANNGTLTPTHSQYVPGIVGMGIALFGQDYVTIIDNNINFPSTLTITAWVKLPTSFNHDMSVYGAQQQDSRDSFDFFIRPSDKKVRLLQYSNNYGSTDVYSMRSISSGQWHNIAVTINGSNWGIYIDGSFDSKGPFVSSYTYSGWTTTVKSCIGGYSRADCNDSSLTFTGSLDQVRVYGQALTSDNIHQIYAEELPKHQLAVAK